MLRKRYSIILSVKQRNTKPLKRTHNFGIEVPMTVAEAINLYENNGNTIWQESISKETKDMRVVFKILEESGKPPPGSQKS